MCAISTYCSTHQYGAEDHGFANVRRVALDHIKQFRMESYSGAGPKIYYYYEQVMPYPPLNLDYEVKLMYTDPIKGTWSPYDLVRWAIGVYGEGHRLDGRLTEEERDPTPIERSLLGDLDTTDRAATFTVTGSSYGDAYRKFNELAMNKTDDKFGYNDQFGGRFNPEIYEFGDGLPLVPPTPQLVDEMLAGTTRDRDEVLGKMKLRAGVITVEKVAINAVMAGAKPEYFPVILAAMESYANGFDNGKMYYHAMSTGGLYGFMLIISGPIAKELGMNSEMGYSGAGNEANNTIGRAVRLCIRNIGHNKTPNIDTTGRVGKQNDHTLTVLVENIDELPDGWKSHSEMMGFPAGSSTITMTEYMANNWQRRIGGEPFAWTSSRLLTDLRRNWGGGAGFMVFSPGMADVLNDEGYASKDDVKEWFATHTTTGATGSGIARNIVWPIVVGTDPGYAHAGGDNGGGINAYQTQLITGATLTENGRGPTAPSAPRDFTVAFNEDKTEATLTWSAPARVDGTLLGYQVTKDDGGETFRSTTGMYATPSNQGINWVPQQPDADGKYMQEMTYTFTGLDPNVQYFFRVRAINDLRNAAEVIGMTNSAGGYGADSFNLRASGTGSWAMYTPPTTPQHGAAPVPEIEPVK